MKLDDRDRRLLSLLQEDCRLSNAELAEAVGMSTSGCWRRVRAFEEAGIVTRYGAHVNPARLGLDFHAIVHVQLTRHDPVHLQEFIAAVQRRDEVLDCFATTGQADYHLRVLCRDIAVYNVFLEEFLFRLPALQSAQTNVVLREIKRNPGAPLRES
jgi:Lrp/AsnC family leucine-responsive transcriptional regulator